METNYVLYNARLVEPGDEVIYPNPGYPIYESCIRYAGGIPKLNASIRRK